jgi:hypothetical protein
MSDHFRSSARSEPAHRRSNSVDIFRIRTPRLTMNVEPIRPTLNVTLSPATAREAGRGENVEDEDRTTAGDPPDGITTQLLSMMLRMRTDMNQIRQQLRDKESSTICAGTPARTTTTVSQSRKGCEALVVGASVGRDMFLEDPNWYTATGMYDRCGNPIWGVPKNKDMKLQLANFSANETYKGLETVLTIGLTGLCAKSSERKKRAVSVGPKA